jgi:hypothetical protein
MRKFVSSVLALALSVSTFGWTIGVSAAESTVTQFEIIVPATAKVNEAIDVTIRALDKDKKVVTGYRGAIIFVPESFWDTVPMPGKSISFSAEDNGEKKFSKWVIFKSTGKQKVSVVDVIDDISWEATVTVDVGGSTGGSGTTLENVTITTPAKDSKITSDVVIVSGKSRKNSKLNVSLNGKDVGSTLSDESGVFTKSISGITQATNLLSVTLVDGAWTVVGKSDNITFEKITSGPSFNNLIVTPGLKLEASSKVTFTIEADAWLSEASILMDGVSMKGKEDTAWKYVIETVAPAKSGEYPIAVNISNDLGQKFNKTAVVTLTISEKPASFDTVKATTVWTKVVFNFGVLNPPADLAKFKIAYGEGVDSFSSENITWNTEKILKGSWRYEWYIDKLDAKTYSFKIMGLKSDNSVIEGLTSEVLSATIGKPTCTVGNVWTVTVETMSDKSKLTWNTVTGALSYNIYKITASGDSVLFQNTKENQYTVYLSSGAIVHENFWIKALCDDKTESADLAKVSNVRTGPWMISIIVIISWIIWAIIMRRRVL